MEIGVVFPFIFLMLSSGIQINCLVDGIKSDGIMKQDENADRVSFLENSGFPIAYQDEPRYAKIRPLYYNNLMKRSPIDRITGRRQTGIIYGDGKPIGILQPYEESFKFMPIKEQKVYSVDGGRSDVDQQEPYLNLMYPLARFARSEDALKMAEYEATRAEFLEKHYPSMLVDFKIRDKLHANRAKSDHQDLKREEKKSNGFDKPEQKRDLSISVDEQKPQKRKSQAVEKRENHLLSNLENQRLSQKREAQKPQKRQTEKAQKREIENSRKREASDAHNDEKNSKKRDADIPQKRESATSSRFEKRQIKVQNVANEEQINAKKKRENSLTDRQFDKLKAVSKRQSKENADMIESDLRGLLNDMGLIEDNLEENAEGIEQAVVEDDESEEELNNPVLPKGKIESGLEEKRDDYLITESIEKAPFQTLANTEPEISFGLGNFESGNEGNLQKKRSNSNPSKDKRRVIDVNFITRNQGDKLQPVSNTELSGNCSRASDIPNKREAKIAEMSDMKEVEKSISEEKVESKTPEASISTTETYAQYEERVAREIKNKIQQLKEEVKRELGALEEDNDEEDEDEESAGEPQRKKRFAANTLLDEEVSNIDPNSNVDNTELLPHVRRRRMLSIDMMDSSGDQKESASVDDSNSANTNVELGSMFENNAENPQIGNDYFKEDVFSAQEKSMEEAALKYLEANNYNRFKYNNDVPNRLGYSNSRWANPLYFKRGRNHYYPQFQKRSYVNYVPWNAMQNSRNTLNSGVYSYETKCEGDGEHEANSKSMPKNTANSVEDMNKKTQDWKFKSQVIPKANKDESADESSGYNQNYYVYYLGKNQDKNVENPLASGIDIRRNPLNNYQQMRMAYPQFPNNMNRMSNKAQYMRADNGDENQKSMMFRIMYNMPSSRRKKRQVGKNFFVPSKDTEDAIVTNTIAEDIPLAERENNNSSNSETYSGAFSDMKIVNPINCDIFKNRESERKNNNEKGEEGFSIGDKTSINASELKMDVKNVNSEGVSGSFRENIRAPITFQDNDERLINEFSGDLDEGRTIGVYKNVRSSSNSTSTLRSGTLGDDRVKSRKILTSSTIQNGIKIPNVEYAQSDRVNSSVYKLRKYLRNEYECQNDNETIENENGYYVTISEMTTIRASKNGGHLGVVRLGRKYIREINAGEELTHLTSNFIPKIYVATSEGSVSGESERDTQKAIIYINNNDSRDDDISGYPLDPAEVEVNKLEKNDLFVPNEEFPRSDWKRRKRGIEEGSGQKDSVRKKRLDWLWPIKASVGESSPQMDEYDQFEINEASDSDKETSERLRDNNVGKGMNYEDLGMETGDYDRKKRQQLEFRPFLIKRNKVPYRYQRNYRRFGSYLPVSRRRRYVDGWYREPHRELLTDMSDVELFGALPQSYAGELNRYKRVKRGRSGRY